MLFRSLVNTYLNEKEADENSGLYERMLVNREEKSNISLSGGMAIIDGDYEKKLPGFMTRFEYQYSLFPQFTIGTSLSYFQLNNANAFKSEFGSIDINAQINILPNDDLAPYIYGGPGFLRELTSSGNVESNLTSDFLKVNYGIGLQYFISPKVGLKAFGEHNILFNDKLDNIVQGKRNDYYYQIGLGLNLYF